MYKLTFNSLIFIGAFTIFSCSTKEYKHEVAPPFEKVTVPFDQFEVDASEEKLIRLASGTSIQVPKNAFVDKNGNPVTGKVKLEYREFSNAADIIASGIPMTYEDEEGNQQQFESAGMFELNGKAGNEEIFLAKGKKVQVNMASPVKGDYDFFYLEEEGKELSEEASFIPSAYGQSDQVEKRKVRWVKLTNNVDEKKTKKEADGPSFTLQVDTTKYPEVKALKDIKWKLAVNKDEFNPLTEKNKWVLEERWQNIEVNPAGKLVKINNAVNLGKNHGLVHQFPDSNEVLLIGDKTESYTMSGEKISSFSEIKKYGGENVSYMNGQRIFGKNSDDEMLMYDRKGRLIKNLGKGLLYGELEKSRFIFSDFDGGYEIASKGSKEFTLKIFDLNGKVLKEITATGYLYNKGNYFYNINFELSVSDDKRNFALLSKEGIRIFDSDGNRITQTETDDVYHINFAEYNNVLLLAKYEGFDIWNWRQNEKVVLPEKYYNTNERTFHWRNSNNHHTTKPLFLFSHLESDRQFLWNWKKGIVTELEAPELGEGPSSEMYVNTYFINDNFIHAKRKGKSILWDLSGNKVLSENGNLYSSEGDKSFFVSSKDKLLWMDSTGKVLKDFKKIDTSIHALYTGKSYPLITTANNGEVRFWNEKGEYVKSVFLNHPTEVAFQQNNSTILAFSWNSDFSLYDTSGILLYRTPISLFNLNFVFKDNKFILHNGESIVFLESLAEKAPANSYQLQLTNKGKSFITYVFLTNEDLEKFEQFKKLKQKGIQVEEERKKKETALIRSFEISNFGIYNWDRFYKDENVLQVEAEFDFGNAVTDRNKVSVFLIAGQNQNTVIKYPESDWSKFSFDPSVPNQMIAVLPEDRIAIFSPEDFQKLNTEDLKKNKKHTFNMKVLDKVSSTEELKKFIKSPV